MHTKTKKSILLTAAFVLLAAMLLSLGAFAKEGDTDASTDVAVTVGTGSVYFDDSTDSIEFEDQKWNKDGMSSGLKSGHKLELTVIDSQGVTEAWSVKTKLVDADPNITIDITNGDWTGINHMDDGENAGRFVPTFTISNNESTFLTVYDTEAGYATWTYIANNMTINTPAKDKDGVMTVGQTLTGTILFTLEQTPA